MPGLTGFVYLWKQRGTGKRFATCYTIIFYIHIQLKSGKKIIVYGRESFLQNGAINILFMKMYHKNYESRTFRDERLETGNRQHGAGSGTSIEPWLNGFVPMLLPSRTCTLDSSDYIHSYPRVSRTHINSNSHLTNRNCAIQPMQPFLLNSDSSMQITSQQWVTRFLTQNCTKQH